MKIQTLLILLLLLSASVQAQQNIEGKSDGMTWVKFDNKYGFLNEDGVLTIPFKYDSVHSFTDGLAAVKVDTNWFYINKKDSAAHMRLGYVEEKDTNRIQYWEIARPFNNGIAVVKRFSDPEYGNEMTWNAINLSGYWALGDFGADSLGDFKNGFAEVVFGKKHGIIDTLDDELVPAIYDDVDSFSNGWVKAKLKGNWMLLNPYGRCVNCKLPPKKLNSSFHTLKFPNVIHNGLFDEVTKFKLSSLIRFMERNPNQRMWVIGYGNSSYVTSQRSWDYVYSIIEYVLKYGNVKREQFIFQYSMSGPYRTVTIRQAKAGDDGPCNTPPPFPNLSIMLKNKQ